MGCVLQPGEVIADDSIKPGSVISEAAVSPGQDIDVCVVAVPENLNLTDATIQEFSTAPTLGNKVAGYELQGDGNVYSIRSEDDGAGPPDFNTLVPLTDWIDYKSYVGTYHCRFTATGGSTSIAQGTLNTWLEIGVDSCLVTIEEANGAGFQNWTGTVEISDDAGMTTADTANITLETDEV